MGALNFWLTDEHLGGLEMLTKFFRDETGLELSEYAVAAALVVAGCVVAFTTLGNSITTGIGTLSNTITG
jgi:pilus assembly protein Flp/PilA